jgi:hypothetical protein
MKKHAFILGGLAVGLLGVSVLATLKVAVARAHYPGAVAVAGDGIDVAALPRGVIAWQAEYVTPDDLAAVRAWYGLRLGISPASELHLSAVDGCVWLPQARLVILVMHTATVLACQDSGGTRITVNETVRPGP